MNSSDALLKDIWKQIQGFNSTPTKICWEVCKWFDFSRRSNHHSTQSQSSCCSYSQVVYWQQPNTKYTCIRSEWSVYIHYQTHSTNRNWWKLLWDGSFKDPKDINVLASNCMLVQTEVCLNHPPNMSKFCFDKQLIMNLGIHLNLSTLDCESASSASHKCEICNKRITLAKMRTHLGLHIINDDIKTQHKDLICVFLWFDVLIKLSKHQRGKVNINMGKK